MVTVAFLWGVSVLTIRFTVASRVKGYAVFLMAFGLLGGVTGLIAGVSRESIVQGLLTGLLGIVTALLSYLFGKESLKEWRNHIPYAIILLIVCCLAGLSIGGSYRNERDKSDREYNEYLLEYEKVYLEVLKEERLIKLRAQNKENQEPVTVIPPNKSVERDVPKSVRSLP